MTAALEVRGLAAGYDGVPVVRDLDLTVEEGEIVAVLGPNGAGKTTTLLTISGLVPALGGTIDLHGRRAPRGWRLARAGVAHVPEDRLRTGTAASLSIEDNLALTAYRAAPMSTGPFLRRREFQKRARMLMGRFDVKASGPAAAVRLLSGGNVQKVLLARELSSQPDLLIAASPTRGLDVGAVEAVRALLVQAAEDGMGVLLISEDLDEILDLSDRIAVMYAGRIVGLVDRVDADVHDLGFLMGGGTPAAASSEAPS